MALALFAGVILYFLYSVAISEIEFQSDTVSTLVSLIFALLFQLVPAAVFLRMQKLSMLEKIKLEKSQEGSVRDNILLAFVGFALIFIFGLLYTAAFPMAAASYDDKTFGQTLLSVISCAVIPAVCEELLYRRLFCRELTVYGNAFAVIGSSLLFALVHYSYYVFPYAFICGLVLGFVYTKTGSVRYTMGIHFMNNLGSYILSRISAGLTYIFYLRLMIILFSVLFVLMLCALHLLSPNISRKFSSKEYGNVSSSAFLTFPMVVFIACAIIMNFI